VVNFSNISGFNNKANLCASFFTDQMVMNGRGEQQ
jgi:hypothetical protein